MILIAQTAFIALLILVIGIFLGLILFPYVLHWRASRSDGIIDGENFDRSNRANTFNVIAHYGTHPEDFYQMQYPDGKQPFYYMNQDLITDTLDVRPK